MKAGFVSFLFGMLLAFGGVGGVEQSVTAVELAQSTGIAIVGLVFMFIGTTYFQEVA